jgi:hypothetical protein
MIGGVGQPSYELNPSAATPRSPKRANMTFCRKYRGFKWNRFQNVQNKLGTAAEQTDILDNGPVSERASGIGPGRFAVQLSDEGRVRFRSLTLGELMDHPPADPFWNEFIRELPAEAIEELACGNSLIGLKKQ